MSDSPRILPMAKENGPGPTPVFGRIAVVGLGLMGGSIALAARKAWPSALVIGVDRSPVLERAMVRHAIDVASEDLMIISEADLVVLSTPVGSILELLPVLPERVAGEAVITDVGGTKRAILGAARTLPPRLPFVGGHPLAGAASRGIDAARADLFAGRPWLLIDEGNVLRESVDRLSTFVQGLGARPLTVPSSASHDRLVAFLSQLPQLTASALMAIVGAEVGEDGLALAGRGLRDTTRLASSPADIWRDICRTNGDEIGASLDALIALLQDLRQHLSEGAAIDRVFGSANQWRERLSLLDRAGPFPAS
jgi:prephenate dehydrogenase